MERWETLPTWWTWVSPPQRCVAPTGRVGRNGERGGPALAPGINISGTATSHRVLACEP